MSQYVYIQSERAGQKICGGVYMEHNLFTVGFYDPAGRWEPESDHSTREAAAERVHYLNGGRRPGGAS
jgi:hypothetical protein